MSIFGPLPCPTTSALTVTLASAFASDVTDSPSTTRRAGSVTVSPAAPTRRLVSNSSPTATLCWRPPLRTIAYTPNSLLGLLVSRGAAARGNGRHRGHRGSSLGVALREGQTTPHLVRRIQSPAAPAPTC